LKPSRLPALLLLLCVATPTLANWDPWQQYPGAPASTATTTSPAKAIPDELLATQEIKPPQAIAEGIDLTQPTDDLWVRIRQGFSMPNLNDELVLSHQQWYLNRPDYLRRMVERSRRYLHFIVEELEKRGMPTELAFLPMVESSFDPMAYSKAHASGLWQFIPATGKRYDLEQNWWHDQRRDVVASTGAALEYLQAIYDMNGDWHLALASYNWGENAVKRAVQKNIANGLPTDFSSLTMPAETRNYVPKLQALKNIFGSQRTVSSLGLPTVPNRPYFATVEPKQAMDVAIAAKLAEMPLAEFRALNPAHNRPLINPNMPLVLPAEKLETFQENLENHDAPLATWQIYTLRAGEKLEKIAPRFGITLQDLKRVNGLHGRLRVTAGASLLVPARNGTTMQDIPDEIRLPEIAPTPSRINKGKATKKAKATGSKRSLASKKKAPRKAASSKSGRKPAQRTVRKR